jgi:hypothetical protein
MPPERVEIARQVTQDGLRRVGRRQEVSLFGKFFKRAVDDPADQLIEWLADKSLDDRRIVVGILYGGPHSLKVCKWVLSRPDCDIGTASMLLWEFGRPDILIEDDPAHRPVDHDVKRELIRFISERWKEGLFATAVFEFDPREHTKLYRRALRKKGLRDQDPLGLPEEAWTPIIGRRPDGSDATALKPANFMDGILGALRLADLGATNRGRHPASR